MSLAEAIVNKKRREIAGARSSNRFDFQKDWALCKLLELHESEEDYLLLCEHHEDIVVLDACVNPTKALFFQIKSRKGQYWTLGLLINRAKGRDGTPLSSILGNLFNHTLAFQQWIGSLNLVSNVHFKIKKAGGDTLTFETFTIFDLEAQEQKRIKKSLAAELGPGIDWNVECRLSVTPLSLESSTHTKGRLEEFLCRRYEGDRHPTSALYRSLFDEIRRRTNFEGDCPSYEILAERKGIGRNQFESFLNCAKVSDKPGDVWKEIEQQLRSENLPFGHLKQLQQEWRQYEVDLLDPTNESLHETIRSIRTLCREALEEDPSSSLSNLVRLVTEKATVQGVAEHRCLRAMILRGLNEEPAVPEANSKPSEEK